VARDFGLRGIYLLFATKRFIEVLTGDAKKREKTASDVDTMLPHLPETDCKHWQRNIARVPTIQGRRPRMSLSTCSIIALDAPPFKPLHRWRKELKTAATR
jgi:hypothetical protein